LDRIKKKELNEALWKGTWKLEEGEGQTIKEAALRSIFSRWDQSKLKQARKLEIGTKYRDDKMEYLDKIIKQSEAGICFCMDYVKSI
jgi:hypothetical protein